MTEYVCPVCGGDPLQRPTQEVMDAIRKAGGTTVNLCDIGGRALEFANGVKMRLSDCCGTCDNKAILDKLK